MNEGPSVTYYTVVKETVYFNINKRGNNILNRIDVTYEQACMASPRDKYYTKMLETLVDCNEHNNTPFSNQKIQEAISKVMAETEAEKRNIISDTHNVDMDTFSPYPVMTNTQGENANTILTSDRLNNSDMLEEILKVLTINDAGYYNSDKNDSEGDPTSDPKVATHTSDGKKRKVTDTSNRNLRQKLLINRTLPIITTPIDPQIYDSFATSRASTIKLSTPCTTYVITDAAHINTENLRTPGHVIRTGRDGSTQYHCDIAVSYPF